MSLCFLWGYTVCDFFWWQSEGVTWSGCWNVKGSCQNTISFFDRALNLAGDLCQSDQCSGGLAWGAELVMGSLLVSTFYSSFQLLPCPPVRLTLSSRAPFFLPLPLALLYAATGSVFLKHPFYVSLTHKTLVAPFP